MWFFQWPASESVNLATSFHSIPFVSTVLVLAVTFEVQAASISANVTWRFSIFCHPCFFIRVFDFVLVVTQFNPIKRWRMDLQLLLMEVWSNWMLAESLTPLQRRPFAPFRTQCLLAWLKAICQQPKTKMALSSSTGAIWIGIPGNSPSACSSYIHSAQRTHLVNWVQKIASRDS